MRLPDSNVIKREFENGQTLRDVRNWIDEIRNDPSAAPYVLQTIFPTSTFEVSEEERETLQSLFGKGGQLILKVVSFRGQS